MLVQTDSRRRITLPASLAIKAGDTLDLEVMEDGRIVLVPIEPVPRHQLWAWTAESKDGITAALADPRTSAVVETVKQAKETGKRWAGES